MRTLLAAGLLGIAVATAATSVFAADPGSWSFAVSGDSRDCGDLVMPKIARSVLSESEPKVAFYWHLGDFRRMYDMDCDVLVRAHEGYDCKTRPTDVYGDEEESAYEASAWQDAIDHQLRPFGKLPVYVGMGNHELYAGHTREEFEKAFRPWLSQKALHLQRLADPKKGIEAPYPTTYRFVTRGVDFVYLDNAGEGSFSPEQIVWLSKVLAADAKDPSVKSLVVAMHAALPRSKAWIHAMDASCQGLCSGQQVYDMLWRHHAVAGRNVYLLASHAHAFIENAYDTPAHAGQVLPGWIVGTAGAIQSGERIRYGWLKMTVAPDGTITPSFREVTRDAEPPAEGPGASNLTDFCFGQNIRVQPKDAYEGDCACGAAAAR